MGRTTKIGWCHSTWNPFRGCVEVSEACDHCYAKTMAKRNPRILGKWGTASEGGTRVVASDAIWGDPYRWNVNPVKPRHLVFTASITDVFEQWDGPMLDSRGIDTGLTMDEYRLKMFNTIRRTDSLTYLLLTKRIADVMPTIHRLADLCDQRIETWDKVRDMEWLTDWLEGKPPENVWLGTTAEDQRWADVRVPELLAVPAAKRFVSYEPALGPVNWNTIDRVPYELNALTGELINRDSGRIMHAGPALNWVIVGGESGPHARPFDIAWARDTIRQCREAGTACFVKQLGAFPHQTMGDGCDHRIYLRDKAGADRPSGQMTLEYRSIRNDPLYRCLPRVRRPQGRPRSDPRATGLRPVRVLLGSWQRQSRESRAIPQRRRHARGSLVSRRDATG